MSRILCVFSKFFGTATTDEDTVVLADHSVENNLNMDGAEWVDFFVREMMSATSIDDARSRATRVLESLEQSISVQAGADAAQSYHKVCIKSSMLLHLFPL